MQVRDLWMSIEALPRQRAIIMLTLPKRCLVVVLSPSVPDRRPCNVRPIEGRLEASLRWTPTCRAWPLVRAASNLGACANSRYSNATKTSHVLLDFDSWICKLKLCSRVMATLTYSKGCCCLSRILCSIISIIESLCELSIQPTVPVT